METEHRIRWQIQDCSDNETNNTINNNRIIRQLITLEINIVSLIGQVPDHDVAAREKYRCQDAEEHRYPRCQHLDILDDLTVVSFLLPTIFRS